MESDALIIDVLHTLRDPEDFVRGVLGSFISNKFDRDQAIIRLGTSGKGVVPNYCIEQGRIENSIGGMILSRHERRSIFNGFNHKQILEDDWMGLRWSSSGMSFKEVEDLLGNLSSGKKI
jgi:hypothetical protein